MKEEKKGVFPTEKIKKRLEELNLNPSGKGIVEQIEEANASKVYSAVNDFGEIKEKLMDLNKENYGTMGN